MKHTRRGFFSGQSVLVTGGAGFIGSHLVDGLLECGARVRILDNLSTGHKENLQHCMDRIEFLEKDLRDLDACKEAVHGASCIFHQAALASVPRSMEYPELTMEVNVQGTVNLFSAAWREGIRSIVYASSSSVYGDSQTLPKREGEEGNLLSPYAYSKKANEDLARLFHDCFDMNFIGMRYFNVFGPRQDPEGPYAAVIPRFFKACITRDPMIVFGDGEQTRDFTYVQDVVQANLLAAQAGSEAWNRAFNIAGGVPITVNQLACQVATILQTPKELAYEAPRPGDIKFSQADISRAREQLNFRPSFSLIQGLHLSRESYLRMLQP